MTRPPAGPGPTTGGRPSGRARTENSKHIGEEEREALPDMRLHTDPTTLDELGLRWLEYRAARERVPDVPTDNKDVDEYIAEHEPQ